MNTHDEHDWCSFVVLYIKTKRSLVLVKDNDKSGDKYKCAGGKKKREVDTTALETAVREIKMETELDLGKERLKNLLEIPKETHIKSFFCTTITEEEFKNMRKGHDIKFIGDVPIKNIGVIRDKILPEHHQAIAVFLSSLSIEEG